MNEQRLKVVRRRRRKRRVRRKIMGVPERPRLSVRRSLKHVYCQIIDDLAGRTLVFVSTLSPDVRGEIEKTSTVDAARKVGERIGEKAVAQGIGAVVFDRGGCKFHGRVKAVAEGARAAGLKF